MNVVHRQRTRSPRRLRPELANLEHRVVPSAVGSFQGLSQGFTRHEIAHTNPRPLNGVGVGHPQNHRHGHAHGAGVQRRGAPYQGVLTYHYDQLRTGSNLNETVLTPQNVGSGNFGKLWSEPVDGDVYAQPLYVQGVRINNRGPKHNVVIVATENDSIYAIDADNPSAGPHHDGVLWQRSYTNPALGIYPVTSLDIQSPDIQPIVGITGTPVLDPSTGVFYFVTKTKVVQGPGNVPEPGGMNEVFIQQLHAVNVATGKEVDGGPVTLGTTTYGPGGEFINNTQISVPGTGSGSVNGVIQFNALRLLQRSGLALDMNVPGHPDGVVILGFASHHDNEPYQGWMLGYDARTLKLVSVFNAAPEGNMGAFWESGDAPVIDPQGNIIMTTGNGAFDAYPPGQAAPAGNTAVGWPGYGIGFGGIPNSVAVPLGVNIPSDAHNYTGLFYNGDFVTDHPVAPNVFRSLDSSPINLNQASRDQAGPHKIEVKLDYDGSTLTETITDTVTQGVQKEVYTNVNIPAAVGGQTAWVGLSAAAAGQQSTHDLTGWTYSTNGSTVVDHAGGFADHSDLTINGDAEFMSSMNAIRLNKTEFDSVGTTFFMNQVNITNFSTTFDFMETPKTNDNGEGIAFVIQNATQMKTNSDYGDTMLKLAPTPGQMTVLDSFTPTDQHHLANLDLDFGTSGTTIIPSQPGSSTPAAAIAIAKNGQLFVVDPNNMNKLGNPVQSFFVNMPPNSRTIGAGQWGSPLYFNGRLYIHPEDDVLKAYQVVPGPNGVPMLDPTPVAQQGPSVYFPGTNPTASANGNSNGIIWDLDLSNFDHMGPAVLHAYDANTLTPLYSSDTSPADQAGPAIKFTTPMVAGGHVFVTASHEVDIYGLRGNYAYGPSPSGPVGSRRFRRR